MKRRTALSPTFTALSAAMALAFALGCGKGDSKAKGTESGSGSGSAGAAVTPTTPPLQLPALGAESPKRFNYLYGDGAAAYDKALAAYKAKPRDWAAVQAGAEAALTKDAFHLDAHRLLAVAQAQNGDYTAAAGHLAAALAGDWARFGASLAADPELATFWASPTGKQLAEAAKTLGEEHLRRGKAGLWLLGRRTTFRLPSKSGVQSLTTRGELYAYDRELRRYLRLTVTEHSLAGFVRSPSQREVALLGYDKVEIPSDASGKVSLEGAKPPLLARPWALTLDAETLAPIGKRAVLPKGRRVAVGYGAGDQLLAYSMAADGRWGVAPPAYVAIDRTTGKTTKTAATELEASVELALEDGEVLAPISGLTVEGEAELSSLGLAGGVEVRIPESGRARRGSVSLSPSGAHLAFATAADPCSAEAAPSLYVADGKTGALRHVLTGKSRFAVRWLDEHVLAYDDPDGMVRLWDASTGREVIRLAEKAGLSLAVLAMSAAPVCKSAPPTAETGAEEEAAQGSEEPVVTPGQ